MAEASDYEKQLNAMRAIMEALKPLDHQARDAVLDWVDGQWRRQSKAPVKPSTAVTGGVQTREGTVSVVAQKIGAKSARDLFLAAAAHLTLFQGKEKFSKADLIACAKEARNWKADYSNQIALNVKRMSDAGILFEKSKDVFGLSDGALKEIEEKLAR